VPDEFEGINRVLPKLSEKAGNMQMVLLVVDLPWTTTLPGVEVFLLEQTV
jgi:hypothetical protein